MLERMAMYRVREAVLIPAAVGSAWRVTFTPIEPDGEDIVLTVTAARLEGMSFAAPYTSIEIEALRQGRSA
jgi:secreted protein with Ig-like and vWFA domain